MTVAEGQGRDTILAEADRIVNGQRREDYGGPFESFSDIARGWAMVLGVEVTPEQVGLCMIQLKVARAKNGGFHRDSFVDIAGYAQCMEFIALARETEAAEGPQPTHSLNVFLHEDGRACVPNGLDWAVHEPGPNDGGSPGDRCPWHLPRREGPITEVAFSHGDGQLCELLPRSDGKVRDGAWVIRAAPPFGGHGHQPGRLCDRAHDTANDNGKENLR